MGPMTTHFPQTRSCFVCGHANPHGLNLAFTRKSDEIVTQWVPAAHHTGFAETIHGGLIATVLDEIMAWTCGILGGRFAYSVDIQIRYHEPLHPAQETIGTGRIISNRRQKIFQTEAELRVGETQIAKAVGKYLAVKAEVEERLWSEFGDAGKELRKQRTSTP